MNETRKITDDDHRFDRLVDGELNADEYRRLLASLDDEPGGWRQCALAFLEAQAWDGEFRSWRRHADADLTRGSLQVRRSSGGIWPLLLATAASFAVAFLLGIQARQWRWNQAPELPVAGGARPPSSAAGVDDAVIIEQPLLAADSNLNRWNQPWAHATLVMDGHDGAPREVNLPVYEWKDESSPLLVENATAIPPRIRRALERRGLEVHDDLRWTPVELEDGRHMMVPFNQVEIRPVSGQAFR